MAPLFITIDLIEIGKLKLNLNEYLILLKLQHDAEGKTFPYVIDPRFVPRLKEDKFIEYAEDSTCIVEKYKLGPAGEKVFKGDDLFEEFYGVFPAKVPLGNFGFRPVSTGDVNGVSAKTTRSIWDRVTKNKPYLQRKIIDNLKKELEHRKSEGSLTYLQNIDTWLRQATWEKWDDIPDKRSSSDNYTKL